MFIIACTTSLKCLGVICLQQCKKRSNQYLSKEFTLPGKQLHICLVSLLLYYDGLVTFGTHHLVAERSLIGADAPWLWRRNPHSSHMINMIENIQCFWTVISNVFGWRYTLINTRLWVEVVMHLFVMDKYSSYEFIAIIDTCRVFITHTFGNE